MRTYTDRFHVGAGTTVGPLTVFPVWSEQPHYTRYDVATDANLRVAELDEPTVENLNITNRQRTPLLVPEGTLLDGGWQTRVVVRDTMVLGGASRKIDVRCVEQGRWNGDQQHELDGRAPISVVAALRGIGLENPAEQGEVWNRVHKLEQHFGAGETGSLLDMMADEGLNEKAHRTRKGARINARSQRRIAPSVLQDLHRIASHSLPGQAGVMVGIGGLPIALELHGNPDALSAQLRAVLGAALVDGAVIDWRPTPGQRARDFAEEIMYTPVAAQRMSPMSQLFAGIGDSADIRSVASQRGHTMHMAVINRRHEVALAS